MEVSDGVAYFLWPEMQPATLPFAAARLWVEKVVCPCFRLARPDGCDFADAICESVMRHFGPSSPSATVAVPCRAWPPRLP